jgi:hypothetical protein
MKLSGDTYVQSKRTVVSPTRNITQPLLALSRPVEVWVYCIRVYYSMPEPVFGHPAPQAVRTPQFSLTHFFSNHTQILHALSSNIYEHAPANF